MVIATVQLCAGTVCVSSSEDLTECSRIILDLVNTERQAASSELKPLTDDDGLKATAHAHAIDMFNRGYFDHFSPEGESPHQRTSLHHRGILIISTGENIWFGTDPGRSSSASELARRILEDWMGSPPHRANILSPVYNMIGISVVDWGDRIYAVQHFAGSAGRIVPPLPASIRRGSTLRFTIEDPDIDLGSPRKFDLVDPVSNRAVCEPVLLNSGHLASSAGVFRIRIYFLSASELDWYIHPGPLIRVP